MHVQRHSNGDYFLVSSLQSLMYLLNASYMTCSLSTRWKHSPKPSCARPQRISCYCWHWPHETEPKGHSPLRLDPWNQTCSDSTWQDCSSTCMNSGWTSWGALCECFRLSSFIQVIFAMEVGHLSPWCTKSKVHTRLFCFVIFWHRLWRIRFCTCLRTFLSFTIPLWGSWRRIHCCRGFGCLLILVFVLWYLFSFLIFLFLRFVLFVFFFLRLTILFVRIGRVCIYLFRLLFAKRQMACSRLADAMQWLPPCDRPTIVTSFYWMFPWMPGTYQLLGLAKDDARASKASTGGRTLEKFLTVPMIPCCNTTSVWTLPMT